MHLPPQTAQEYPFMSVLYSYLLLLLLMSHYNLARNLDNPAAGGRKTGTPDLSEKLLSAVGIFETQRGFKHFT